MPMLMLILMLMLHTIIARLMKQLTCRSVPVEEGSTCLAQGDARSDSARSCRPL